MSGLTKIVDIILLKEQSQTWMPNTQPPNKLFVGSLHWLRAAQNIASLKQISTQPQNLFFFNINFIKFF